MSDTSKVIVERMSDGFYLKLNLVKGIVGGNSEDSSEVRFGEEVHAVVYCGDNHVGSGGITLIYIDNR